MAAPATPQAAKNGQTTDAAPAPIQDVVVLSAADYERLVTDQRHLAELREQHEWLELRFNALRDSYQNVHHAYYELVKDNLPPEDPNWVPPPPEHSVSLDDLRKELESEGGAK
jgi:hypothetical protein